MKKRRAKKGIKKVRIHWRSAKPHNGKFESVLIWDGDDLSKLTVYMAIGHSRARRDHRPAGFIVALADDDGVICRENFVHEIKPRDVWEQAKAAVKKASEAETIS